MIFELENRTVFRKIRDKFYELEAEIKDEYAAKPYFEESNQQEENCKTSRQQPVDEEDDVWGKPRKAADDLYEIRDTFPPQNPDDKTSKLQHEFDLALKLLYSIPAEQRKLPVHRATYEYLRGKILDVVPDYRKEAEDHLSKAVKLNPSLGDAWLCLGNCIWKKGDLTSAKNCFNLALSKVISHIRVLTFKCPDISSSKQTDKVLKSYGLGADNQAEMVEESIQHVKEAITLDVKDDNLGNACLTSFFVTGTWDHSKLLQSLKAYQNAEKDERMKSNPDLYFNCATVNRYLENYDRALAGFEVAALKDPSLNASQEVEKMVNLLDKLENLLRIGLYRDIPRQKDLLHHQLVLLIGHVERVFIPKETRNPKHKFSTFAFVQFGSEAAETSKSKEVDDSSRSLRDDRTYKDALLTNRMRSSALGYRELSSDGIHREKIKENILEMCIPSESSSVIFKTYEEMMEAWMKKKDEIGFWFDRLAPLLNEDEVPMAFCQVELFGVPLLCWNDSFLERIAGRWGAMVDIHDTIKNREDLTTARILIRVYSPFDVPKVITLGYYGISYKVRIKIGSVHESSKPFFTKSPVGGAVGEYFGELMFEEVEDREESENEEGSIKSTEKFCQRVDTRIDQAYSLVEVGGEKRFPRLTKYGKGIKSGCQIFRRLGVSKWGSLQDWELEFQIFQLMGLRPFQKIMSIKRNKTKGLSSNSESTDCVGIEAQNTDLMLIVPNSDFTQSNSRDRSFYRSRSLFSTKSEPLERKSMGSYKRVYKRSRETIYWFGNEQNIIPVREDDLDIQKVNDQTLRPAQQVSLTADSNIQDCEEPTTDRKSGVRSLDRELEGDFNVYLYEDKKAGSLGVTAKIFPHLLYLIDHNAIMFENEGVNWVLVNRVSSKEFPIAKGLRQGCSMSPLMFNLVGEQLNLLLLRAIFEGSKMQILNVKKVLRVFKVMSGLQLNLKKNKLIGINISQEDVQDWAESIGCAVGCFPSSYLGLPLGANRNSSAIWDPVGNVTNKIHWVNWNNVCNSKNEGGLGVRNLNSMNRALLGKWSWRKVPPQASWIWRSMVNNHLKDDPFGSKF
ncbi:putative undecaprenyl diphosphate synthase [Hibiscus syriacus]|uniref:Undecaprenyl diphosphate synthase n=1 Tax=Hibiscus syriacus TaxID=106335 RepID=A0A6A2XGD0_HIBSY|nr:putative undecaprenyl diphosphate synthase [Hibiscus syriacus]